MTRDIEKERQIGIMSIICLRNGQTGDRPDAVYEWEIETTPDMRMSTLLGYCRRHLCDKGVPYGQWSASLAPQVHYGGYYRLYRSLGNIWTYKVYIPNKNKL